jgi:hypothetical protein
MEFFKGSQSQIRGNRSPRDEDASTTTEATGRGVELPRATKRPHPRRDTRKQLRSAALRLWKEDTTPRVVAERLGVKVSWIQEALEPVRISVLDRFGPGTNADDIAQETGAPVAFVKYVIRRACVLRSAR